MSSRILLETHFNEFVHTAEVEKSGVELSPLVIWRGRYFVRDFHFSDLQGKRYVEVVPLELPSDEPEAVGK